MIKQLVSTMLFTVLLSGSTEAARSGYGSFEQGTFRDPENTFRAAPFYSLNDKLEAEEMRRQIGLMKEAGYGGAFLHSRIGLLTPYLQTEWFDLMRAGTEALETLDMDVWYYDEDKWPSGFAGGLVPRADPAFQARSLIRLPKTVAVQEPDSVLWEDENWNYVCRVNPMGQARYNGTSWVDLMNPEVTELFIESSYVPYVELFGGRSSVRGMFTDEPNVFPRPETDAHAGAISYSPVMDEMFRERCGYDLHPVLPALFDTVGDWRTVRLDYYRTVAWCFEQAFSKPIGEFCASHGLTWTGHYNGEDTPELTMRNTGNLMQQLRHMQQPGLDALALRFNTVYSAKGVTSVANQYGRERRLCELFGISGHNMSFEDRIWITAWNSIMGINFMCPHLYMYSLKGERKRDYPPHISHQQPYWKFNKLFEDYSARLCYFGTVGKTVGEICVIHPQESVYLEDVQQNLITPVGVREPVPEALLAAHRNFDFGDEQIISEIGRVEAGQFVIGEMSYGAVVTPELKTIRPGTIELLIEFMDAGGPVFLCGDMPVYVDGRPDHPLLTELKTRVKTVPVDQLETALQQNLPARFGLSGSGAGEIWTHLRETDNGTAILLSNTSRTDTHTVTVSIPEEDAALWNPVNGECLRIHPESPGRFTLQFAPAQNWIITTGTSARQAVFDGEYTIPAERRQVLALEGDWQGRRHAPNAIVLDYASFSRDGGNTWSEPEPVLAFYDRAAYSKPYNGPLLMRYEVTVEDVPSDCRLVVEQPEMYSSIVVNGRPVAFNSSDFYLDVAFRVQDLAGLLEPGKNEIVLSLDFRAAVPGSYDAYERYGTEIESIYLIGNFAVKTVEVLEPLADTWRNRRARLQPKAPVNRIGSFSITNERTEFYGDLTLQGYPFYAGSFELSQTFVVDEPGDGSRYILSFPGSEATVIGIEVNGMAFQPLFTSPWEADITAALKSGENRVKLTLTNTLRNLMGPFHHKGGEFAEVRPATFRAGMDVSSTMPEPTGELHWYDVRNQREAILWRDFYHIISFGLLEAPVILKTR